eukprot:CAMPEP_0197465146 /NCGR_PEP_ID=MMETSP1175-20131217/64388_1 /TAXON_ID=1003142 /ORGANISM="Triceratium dubium, Strain CCMP147" /LENGTH=386 /DNA_ID=CAMNT_0043001151 /DNA_START=120 /DNA_END=1280 /DNA_ORIENTATION=+
MLRRALPAWVALACVGSGTASSVRGQPESSAAVEDVGGFTDELKETFRRWMESFDKDYKSAEEKIERMMIWLENHEMIERHNSKDPAPSYTLGHNQFSDLTHDEYKKMNFLGEHSPGMLSPPRVKIFDETQLEKKHKKKLPKTVDWVEKGAVTDVKNQGMCGSCWAFSAIGAIEGAHFLDTGELVSLSEQEVLDCDTDDKACFGGLMDNAFKWDEHSGGICSEEDYPYAGRKHFLKGCKEYKSECDDVPHTEVKTFIDVKHSNANLKESISIQPTSVAIEADGHGFQFYKSGVYDDPDCGVKLDHGVLAVGYGKQNGTDYWVIKNSWGATWGDQGYIKMSRDNPNNGKDKGQCGILMAASRPILKDNEPEPEPPLQGLRAQTNAVA